MNNRIEEAGYRIIEPIASGGMGQVFKAEHIITKRIEAIKVLCGAGTEAETDRFLREIQLQASLSHPNIASVYNAFRLDDDLVMVMELVEGESLRTALQRGRLAPDLAVRYACEVLSAIGYAHAHGVIHRDISPSNIVITPQGSIKLMDFGLAKAAASPSASQSGLCLGSPHYMSPEQVTDAMRASPRSDIYSLGAVLYEMVTGRKVFESDSSFIVMQAQVETIPKPPIQLNPSLPAALNEAILKALAKDSAQRFADADAFRQALEAPQPVAALAATPIKPINPTKKRSRPAWLVPALQFSVTCAVILLPTAFYEHARHRPQDPKSASAPAKLEVAPAPAAAPETAMPAAPVSPERPAAPVVHPFSPPSPRRNAQRRAPVQDLTPTVLGEEPPPAPIRRLEPAHPSVALAPAPTPPKPKEPVVPDRPAPAPTPAAAAPAETQSAGAPHEEPADASKDKKQHGRIRRALGKIFSPFHSR
jgi:serine/threonine-protein kinase